MTNMTPTRTRNNDTANLTTSARRLWSRNQGDTVEMGIANASTIYAMLSDLSAMPGNYVIREAYSNAYDATLRAGDMGRLIEIELPAEGATQESDDIVTKLANEAATTSTLTVTDHGCGMSYDEVCSYFLQYGGSDKTDEIDSIGSKGLGAKAPLAIANSFDLTTTRDGITTHAHITRQPKKAGAATVYTEETGAESGTTVTIPITSAFLVDQMWQFVHSMERFSTDANVSVNGQLIQAKLPRDVGENSDTYICLGEVEIPCDPPTKMRAWQLYSPTEVHNGFDPCFPRVCRNGNYYETISALVGGVVYPIDHDSRHPYFIVEVGPGWLDFTPSRDAIKMCDTTEAFEKALRMGLSRIDLGPVIDRHVMVTDAVTRCRLRANSEIKTALQPRSNKKKWRDESFTFVEDAVGNHHVLVNGRNKYRISDATFQRVADTKCDIDVIVIKRVHPDARQVEISVNGRDVIKKSAHEMLDEMLGDYDQRRAMWAISHPDDVTPNVITGVTCKDDVTWIIRNEAAMRASGLIRWDTLYYAALFLVDDIAKVDRPVRDVLATLNTIALDDAKACLSHACAKRRLVRRQRLQASAPDPLANQPWAKSIVNVIELPHGLTEEELMLWMLQPKRSSLPCAQDARLDKLGAGADQIAIAIMDSLPERAPDAHDLACMLAMARLKDPTCIPDTVRYAVATDAKHLQAKEFTSLIEQGAFLVADRRTKLKSVRTDGLADTWPDLITVSAEMDFAVDCSGITDHDLLARVLEFGRDIGADEVARCDTRMAALAFHGVDQALLSDDAADAMASATPVMCQYRTRRDSATPDSHIRAYPLTLCGNDLDEESLRRGDDCHTTRKSLLNVPGDVRQALADADQIAIWFRDLLGPLGITSIDSDPELDATSLARLKAFAPALSADMNANFTRKVV